MCVSGFLCISIDVFHMALAAAAAAEWRQLQGLSVSCVFLAVRLRGGQTGTFFPAEAELLTGWPPRYRRACVSNWTVSVYPDAELQVNVFNVWIISQPSSCGGGSGGRRRSVTEALCESRMLTSPGAPLMMEPPSRQGEACVGVQTGARPQGMERQDLVGGVSAHWLRCYDTSGRRLSQNAGDDIILAQREWLLKGSFHLVHVPRFHHDLRTLRAH